MNPRQLEDRLDWLENNPVVEDLLYERLKQLREIDERLERIVRGDGPFGTVGLANQIESLRLDLAVMINRAQEEYEAF